MTEITPNEFFQAGVDGLELLNQDPRQAKRYRFADNAFRRGFVRLATLLVRLLMTVEVQGQANLPAKGAVVLAANHLTNFDVFPIQLSLERPLFFMAKVELHKNVLMDALLRQLGAFPVQRGQRDPWALAHAVEVLEHEQVLALFPEGTRSKGRGLRPGKTGAARFALQTGCPILPVAVTGTERMFKGFPRRTQVSIRIGEPLYPQPGETALGLTDRLMFTIAEMLPPELRGVYAEHPAGFD
jgi:1-acyl-sn-glycerol-3-phosphate acyltransferase